MSDEFFNKHIIRLRERSGLFVVFTKAVDVGGEDQEVLVQAGGGSTIQIVEEVAILVPLCLSVCL